MSLKHDRKQKCTTKYVDTSVAGEQTLQGSVDEEMFSTKKIFRGFEKRPIVLLERCNIIPFINNHLAVYKQKEDSVARFSENKQINVHLQKLALRCSVMLVKEDLEKLREDFVRKCRNENPANQFGAANKSYNGNMRSRDDQTYLQKYFKHQNHEISNQPRKRVQTNYEHYYFCDQCLMRFETETNMLQHKQSHSKIESTKSSQLKQHGLTAQQTEEQNGTKANNNNAKNSREELPTIIININDEINGECGKILYSLLKPSINETKKDSNENTVNVTNFNVESIDYSNPPKKAIVDPRSKKTIISRFNCEVCGKYYSSRYTLSRHKTSMHRSDTGLQCHVCEETFVWPSLLESHRCIRRNIPEMPFDDARPEIMFDNLEGSIENPYILSSEDDDMEDVYFDMPAPIVELTEYNDQFILTQPNVQYNNVNNLSTCVMPLPETKYKLVMQEVPIEF